MAEETSIQLGEIADYLCRIRNDMPDRRERIATACLAGLLACPSTTEMTQSDSSDNEGEELAEYRLRMACVAVEHADALILALSQPSPSPEKGTPDDA